MNALEHSIHLKIEYFNYLRLQDTMNETGDRLRELIHILLSKQVLLFALEFRRRVSDFYRGIPSNELTCKVVPEYESESAS